MIDSIKLQFLTEVLGADGANALVKATQADPRLSNIIIPRTVMGWLSFIGDFNFTGQIPGIDNSSIELNKNEDSTYSGHVTISEDCLINLDKADIYRVTSAISVALGETAVIPDESVKNLVLFKLGTSIDSLAKAQEITKAVKKSNVRVTNISKSIGSISPGTPLKDGGFSYDHVLQPEHLKQNYSVKVTPVDNNKFEATLHQHGNPDPIGIVEADHKDGKLNPSVSTISQAHKGKGLGTAMYEALFAHGLHNGIHTIQGDIHSTDASKVHQRLAAKHGLEYNPTLNPGAPAKASTAYDSKFSAYKYILKSIAKADLPGKTAAPVPALDAKPPMGPQPANLKPKKPKLPTGIKAPTIKIGKSEADIKCVFCNDIQFKHNKLVGCACLSDLSKSVTTTSYKDGYVLDFENNFSKEAYLALSKYFRGEQ